MKRKCAEGKCGRWKSFPRQEVILLVIGAVLWSLDLFAQSGQQGIEEADSQVRGYFGAASNLVYAIGGIVGLVGAVKVYNKWSNGDQDTGKVAASWFGSCIFLVVVATVLRSFFGIA